MIKLTQIKIAIIVLSIMYAGILWLVPPLFNHPVSISMEMKAGKDEICQIFYGSGIRGFSEKQSITRYYAADEDFINIDIPIISRTKIRNLRIDPVTIFKEFQIRNITLRVGSNEICYEGKAIDEHFEPINTEVAGIMDGVVSYTVKGRSDAQLVFRQALDEIFETERSTAKTIFFVVSALLYLIFLVVIIPFSERILLFYRPWIQALNRSAETAINSEIVLSYLRENKILLIFSFFVAVFSFGYEFFNFSLSIDEELDSFRTAIEKREYILNGRWGAYLLNLFINPTSVLPFFPTFIALFCIVFSSVLFVSKENTSLSTKLVFSAIFISSPAHAHFLAFSSLSLYFAFGMSLATMSFVLLKNAIEKDQQKIAFYALSMAMLTLAISMYQALFAFYLVFCAWYLFTQSLKWNKINWHLLLKIIAGIFVVCASGFLLYKIFDSAIRYFVLGAISSSDKQYLDNFILWGKSPTKEIIINLINIITKYLTGWVHFRQAFGMSLFSIMILTPIILLFIVKNKTEVWAKILSGILFIIFILSSFSMIIINGDHLAARTLMSIPLMIAMLWLLVYNLTGRWLRKIMAFVAIIILINNTFINTRLFYSANVAWEADRAIANRVIERIYALEPPTTGGKIPVAFIGKLPQPANELFYSLDIFGLSFFSIGDLSPGRVLKVFKILGDSKSELHIVKPGEPSLIENMPSWPEMGSVKIIDEVVYVKLSESKTNM